MNIKKKGRMNRKERKKLKKAVDRVLEATVTDLAVVGWTIEIVPKEKSGGSR